MIKLGVTLAGIIVRADGKRWLHVHKLGEKQHGKDAKDGQCPCISYTLTCQSSFIS